MNLDTDFDSDNEEQEFADMLHSPLEGIADSVIADIVSKQVRVRVSGIGIESR